MQCTCLGRRSRARNRPGKLERHIAGENMASDAKTVYSQQDHLQMKYIGTGHPDTTKWEWAVNQHRDTYASYVGHHSLRERPPKPENLVSTFISTLSRCGPRDLHRLVHLQPLETPCSPPEPPVTTTLCHGANPKP